MKSESVSAMTNILAQEIVWIDLDEEEPEKTVTVLLATESSIAIGHIGIEGNIIVEFMPWGQEQAEQDEPEFRCWAYLPAAPDWISAKIPQEARFIEEQLRLWN